eukprot:COSAG02_NODE_97_length_37159_cov_37.660335_3_plen_93_part_00
MVYGDLGLSWSMLQFKAMAAGLGRCSELNKQQNGPTAYMFEKGDNGPSNLTQPQADVANFLLVRGPCGGLAVLPRADRKAVLSTKPTCGRQR